MTRGVLPQPQEWQANAAQDGNDNFVGRFPFRLDAYKKYKSRWLLVKSPPNLKLLKYFECAACRRPTP